MPDDGFLEYVLDQLSDLPGLRARAMFGGHGLYLGDRFFAIIFRSRLFFRTDDATRPEYRKRGSKPFRVSVKVTLKTYCEVPTDVLENRDEAVRWARASVAAASAAAAARR